MEERYVEKQVAADLARTMVFVAGPRQVGKTCQWASKMAHFWALKTAHFQGASRDVRGTPDPAKGAERPERGPGCWVGG